MKKDIEKSGQKKRKGSILHRFFEFLERVSDHFSDLFLGRLKNVREVKLWVVEWMLLVLSVFLLAIVQLCWYGDSYESTAFVEGGTYSEATLGKVSSLNPLYATTSSERTLSKLLFANLVSPDRSGHLKGELVKEIASEENDTVWNVTLRDEIYWSDGEPIVADDLVYTVNLIADNAAKTTISTNFSNVSVEKIDDKKVKFTLPSAYPDFMDLLEFPVVPEHVLGEISSALVYESDFSKNPVSSGPFRINAIQTVNSTSKALQTVYLNRNDKYFKDNTRLEAFNVKTYASLDDIRDALNNVEVNGTAELGGEDMDSFAQYDYRRGLINGGVFAFMNTKNVSVKERKAIQMGVNMKTVRGELLKSQAIDYPILSSQGDYEKPALAEFDFDKAKTLLTDDGFVYKDGKLYKDDERVALKVEVLNRETQKGVAERYADELKKLGFEVELDVFDETQAATDFFSAIIRPRKYDILIYEVDLGVSADPFVYYSSTQATANGWNFSNYSNKMVDDALLSGRLTTDSTLRKAKYDSFLKYWVDEVPAVGIYQSSLNYYYTRNIETFGDDTTMTDTLDRFVDVNYWGVDKEHVKLTP